MGYKYPWGDNWISNNCLNYMCKGLEQTSTVYSFPEGISDYGIFNSSGNVLEWCYDWFDPDYYQHPGVAFNPRGPVVGRGRVLRGNSGDHIIPPVFLGSFSATQRSSGHGDERWYCIGFRLARTMR